MPNRNEFLSEKRKIYHLASSRPVKSLNPVIPTTSNLKIALEIVGSAL